MEQLRALGAQLLAIWSQLGVNQKLTVAASGFIVAVTLAVVVFFTSRTDFVLLYGGLDPKDAGDVVAVLEEQSVLYEAGAGGTSIKQRGGVPLIKGGVPRGVREWGPTGCERVGPHDPRGRGA